MTSRRQFIGILGVGSLMALSPLSALAATPRVVVVGGGMAGATVAKYLRLWSNRSIDVTLVVPSDTYVSNIMSNLVVTGQMSYSALKFTYANLAKSYGVKIVYGTVTAVSGYGTNATGTVTVTNGPAISTLNSERLVLAPGIEMDRIPVTGGTTTTEVLHAWQAGQQTLDLQALLAAIPNGGTYVMTIPAKPYRCPPGPYERACVVADYLKRNKPGARIVVLDANPSIVAEPIAFGNAFRAYNTAGVLEYWPSTSVISVSNATTRGANQTVTANYAPTAATSGALMPSGIAAGTVAITGNVMNIIAPHRAGKIVFDAGLVPVGGRFAPVDVLSFESTLVKNIHVIGDASQTSLPKAGHVGNQGAKICANAIVNAFKGLGPDPEPTANSACFSPINSTQASWLTAVYKYDPTSRTMVLWNGVTNAPASPATATEAANPSTGNFSKMNTWFKVLMSDSFA